MVVCLGLQELGSYVPLIPGILYAMPDMAGGLALTAYWGPAVQMAASTNTLGQPNAPRATSPIKALSHHPTQPAGPSPDRRRGRDDR